MEATNPKSLSLGKCLLIFFLAIIALAAEFVLYMFFGVGSQMAGARTGIVALAFFFVFLMIYTAVIGIAAIIGAIMASARDGGSKSYRLLVNTVKWGAIVWALVNVMFFAFAYPKVKAYERNRNHNSTEIPGNSEAKYLDKILITSYQVENTWGDRYMVKGEIKNTGDQALDEVEITVFAKDAAGKNIFEQKDLAVYVSEYSLNDEGPLKPNYSRKFLVDMSDAPSEWNKKVEIKVTNLEFSEQEFPTGDKP
jgi:hypothetical protein